MLLMLKAYVVGAAAARAPVPYAIEASTRSRSGRSAAMDAMRSHGASIAPSSTAKSLDSSWAAVARCSS